MIKLSSQDFDEYLYQIIDFIWRHSKEKISTVRISRELNIHSSIVSYFTRYARKYGYIRIEGKRLVGHIVSRMCDNNTVIFVGSCYNVIEKIWDHCNSSANISTMRKLIFERFAKHPSVYKDERYIEELISKYIHSGVWKILTLENFFISSEKIDLFEDYCKSLLHPFLNSHKESNQYKFNVLELKFLVNMLYLLYKDGEYKTCSELEKSNEVVTHGICLFCHKNTPDAWLIHELKKLNQNKKR